MKVYFENYVTVEGLISQSSIKKVLDGMGPDMLPITARTELARLVARQAESDDRYVISVIDYDRILTCISRDWLIDAIDELYPSHAIAMEA